MKRLLFTISLLLLTITSFAQNISDTQLLALGRTKATVKKMLPAGYTYYKVEENDYGYTDLYKKGTSIIGYSFNFREDICQNVGTSISHTSWKAIEAGLAHKYKKHGGMWYANHNDPFVYSISRDKPVYMLVATKNTEY